MWQLPQSDTCSCFCSGFGHLFHFRCKAAVYPSETAPPLFIWMECLCGPGVTFCYSNCLLWCWICTQGLIPVEIVIIKMNYFLFQKYLCRYIWNSHESRHFMLRYAALSSLFLKWMPTLGCSLIQTVIGLLFLHNWFFVLIQCEINDLSGANCYCQCEVLNSTGDKGKKMLKDMVCILVQGRLNKHQDWTWTICLQSSDLLIYRWDSTQCET